MQRKLSTDNVKSILLWDKNFNQFNHKVDAVIDTLELVVLNDIKQITYDTNIRMFAIKSSNCLYTMHVKSFFIVRSNLHKKAAIEQVNGVHVLHTIVGKFFDKTADKYSYGYTQPQDIDSFCPVMTYSAEAGRWWQTIFIITKHQHNVHVFHDEMDIELLTKADFEQHKTRLTRLPQYTVHYQ